MSLSSPVVLFPDLGEGYVPDLGPVAAALEARGCSVFAQPIVSVLDMLSRHDVALVSFLETRGCLSDFVRYQRVIDVIHRATHGRDVGLLPNPPDRLPLLAGKAEYLTRVARSGDVEVCSMALVEPGEHLGDRILAAADALPADRFVFKPSVGALAFRIAFLDRAADGSATLSLPRSGGASLRRRFSGRPDLARQLSLCFDHLPSAHGPILVQAFQQHRFEVSIVAIGQARRVVRRTPGSASRVAHEQLGGTNQSEPDPGIRARGIELADRVLSKLMPVGSSAGIARVDFFVADDGRMVLNEVESVGGFRKFLDLTGDADAYAAHLLGLFAGSSGRVAGWRPRGR